MMQSLNISTSALRGIQTALDQTSNNLANIDTIGYKQRGVGFSELLVDNMSEQPYTDKQRTSPAGLRINSGVKIGLTPLDMTQGSEKITNIPTDLMIEGDGFFMVGNNINDADPAQQKYYLTRNGAFHLTPSITFPGELNLVTSSGQLLVDQTGAEITVPNGSSFKVERDGTITVDGDPTGVTIPVFQVNNTENYEQVSPNEFALTQEDKDLLTPATEVGIKQGALEASNVNMTKEMAQLMQIQRAYQFNSRAIAVSDQMMGIANSLRGR